MYTHSIHYADILYNKDLIFILTDINMQDCKAEQNTYVNPSIYITFLVLSTTSSII